MLIEAKAILVRWIVHIKSRTMMHNCATGSLIILDSLYIRLVDNPAPAAATECGYITVVDFPRRLPRRTRAPAPFPASKG